MRRRDFNITSALCTSLVLHAGLAIALIWHYILTAGAIYLPALSGPQLASAALAHRQVPEADQEEFGTHDGTGAAFASMPGDEPMQARKADQDQPFLSRDPMGPGKVGAPPSQSLLEPGDNGQGGQAAQDGGAQSPMPLGAHDQNEQATPKLAVKPPPVHVKPEEKPAADHSNPTPADPMHSETAQATPPPKAPDIKPDESASNIKSDDSTLKSPPDPKTPTTPPTMVAMATPTPPAMPNDVPTPPDKTSTPEIATPAMPPPGEPAAAHPEANQTSPAQTNDSTPGAPGNPGRPGPHVPAADPAMQSDSESDPFTRVANVTFRGGRVDARFGRKIRTVRPQFDLAGTWDGVEMGRADVILAAKVDATGKIVNVDVVRSSGSDSIDQPWIRSVYGWWIEPPTDKKGKAVPDLVILRLGFR